MSTYGTCLACLLSHKCFALCLTYVCAQKCRLVFFKSVTMSCKNNSSDNAVKVNDKAQWTLHVFMSSTICSDDTKLEKVNAFQLRACINSWVAAQVLSTIQIETNMYRKWHMKNFDHIPGTPSRGKLIYVWICKRDTLEQITLELLLGLRVLMRPTTH